VDKGQRERDGAPAWLVILLAVLVIVAALALPALIVPQPAPPFAPDDRPSCRVETPTGWRACNGGPVPDLRLDP